METREWGIDMKNAPLICAYITLVLAIVMTVISLIWGAVWDTDSVVLIWIVLIFIKITESDKEGE